MANLLGIPEQHLFNWGDALISKDTPWKTTPEYHQWGAQDLTQEKSKEIAKDYGNLAAGAFELAAPVLALGASPIYDTAQAFSKYNLNPGKYEINNKWDKINAYFPDLQGTTVSGILNAIDQEDILSAAYNRMIGAGKPVFNRMFDVMKKDKTATQKGIIEANMQRQIREAEDARVAQEKAAAQAAAARQVRQNIRTYGSGDRPDTGMNAPGGGRGQSPTGGNVQGTPFARGGIVNLLYGGMV